MAEGEYKIEWSDERDRFILYEDWKPYRVLGLYMSKREAEHVRDELLKERCNE